MSDYEIVDTNADNIDGCSFCGYTNADNLGLSSEDELGEKRCPEPLFARNGS